MREFEKLAQHLTICAPSVAQHAALACFSPDSLQIFEKRRLEFQRRRDFLVPALERAGLAVPARPSGAFYVYAAVPRRRDAKRFALICWSAKASRRRRASISARTKRSATCASPTRAGWRTSKRPPSA